MNSAGGRCHDNARCESMWPRMKEEYTITCVFEELESLGLSIPVLNPETKKRGRPKKEPSESKLERPRGRPRKKP